MPAYLEEGTGDKAMGGGFPEENAFFWPIPRDVPFLRCDVCEAWIQAAWWAWAWKLRPGLLGTLPLAPVWLPPPPRPSLPFFPQPGPVWEKGHGPRTPVYKTNSFHPGNEMDEVMQDCETKLTASLSEVPWTDHRVRAPPLLPWWGLLPFPGISENPFLLPRRFYN